MVTVAIADGTGELVSAFHSCLDERLRAFGHCHHLCFFSFHLKTFRSRASSTGFPGDD